MSTPDRAAWARAMRLIISIVEADPAIPVPFAAPGAITWSLYVKGDAALAARIEAALPCELTGAVRERNEDRYALSGEIGGITVEIEAWTSEMAEKRVTGTTTVDTVEWVRLPVQDETPESGAAE